MTTQRKSSGGSKPAARAPLAAKPSQKRSAAPEARRRSPTKGQARGEAGAEPVAAAKKPAKGSAKPALAVPNREALKPVKPPKPPAVVRPLGVLPPESMARRRTSRQHVAVRSGPAPRPVLRPLPRPLRPGASDDEGLRRVRGTAAGRRRRS
jgi:hypothetical protein